MKGLVQHRCLFNKKKDSGFLRYNWLMLKAFLNKVNFSKINFGKTAVTALAIALVFGLMGLGLSGIATSKPAEIPADPGSMSENKIPAAGSSSQSEFQSKVIGVENATGFEETDPVKESFVLASVSQSAVSGLLAKNINAVLISVTSNGKAIVAYPADAIDEIAAIDATSTFEENLPILIATEQKPTPTWGIDRIDQAALPLNSSYTYETSGSGVIIYVIDTGINSTHQDLSGRVLPGFTTINDGNGWSDCNGHGTHVAGTAAGTAYGVAKSAKVVPVRVLNCTGNGYVSDIISGLDWISNNHPGGPAVINMSIGGGLSSMLNAAVQNASSKGFVVVAAAGNSSADACNSSPVSAGGVIGVGASNSSDQFASFSNYGSCVDFIAPGVGITSAWIGSNTAVNAISGTSMASPHVAGMAARLLQQTPGLGTSGVQNKITELSVSGAITGNLRGTPNVLLNWSTELVASPSPTPTLSPSPTASPTKTKGRSALKAPGRIKSLNFTQVSETEIEFNWAAMDSSVKEINVEWVSKLDASTLQNASLAGSVTSLRISNLQIGVPYEVRVTPIAIDDTTRIAGATETTTLMLAKRTARSTSEPNSKPSSAPAEIESGSPTSTPADTSPGNSGNKGNQKNK